MPPARTRSSIRFSILDRLTGVAEVQSVQPVREMSAEGLRRSVLTDLKRLLNTRNDLQHWLARYQEVRRSHLAFGIPDLSTYSQSNVSDRQQICGFIEEAIRTFEPRFVRRSVRVSLVPSEDVDDFRIHFRIEGTLYVEPIEQPVAFDTTMEMDTGAIEIGESF
ncbi:MAG: type VI secretion system baseplate subunit TssE [Planctomycetota bacterium]